MTESMLHHALVVMLAMRLPDLFTAPAPFQESNRSISDKWRKYQQRQPEGPITAHPSYEAHCRRQES